MASATAVNALVRRHLEQGLAIDGRRLAQLAHTEATRCDHLAVLDDGDRHPGYVEGLHGSQDVRFQVEGGRFGGGSGGNGLGRLGQRGAGAEGEQQGCGETVHRGHEAILQGWAKWHAAGVDSGASRIAFSGSAEQDAGAVNTPAQAAWGMGAATWGPSFLTLPRARSTWCQAKRSGPNATARSRCPACSAGVSGSSHRGTSRPSSTTGRRSCTSSRPPAASAVTMVNPLVSGCSDGAPKCASAARNRGAPSARWICQGCLLPFSPVHSYQPAAGTTARPRRSSEIQ